MTDTKRADMLRAVLRDPRDNVVRGAYADWLDSEERPDETEDDRWQAELIRIQLGLVEPEIFSAEKQSEVWFSSREAQLVGRLQQTMQGSIRERGLIPFGRMISDYMEFHRGFVGWIRLTPAMMYDGLALRDIFSEHPISDVSVAHILPVQVSGLAWQLPALPIPISRRVNARSSGVFSTSTIATDVLSAAIVDVGREFAGLPVLEKYRD